MIHGLLSLVTCVIFFLLGLPWPAYFLPAAFYMGREHAQAEYRYIAAHGGKRDKCLWYCGFVPSAWTWKAVIDWILPWVIGILGAICSSCVPFWSLVS